MGNINTLAKKSGFWYTVCNLLLKGCVFFSLPIFTRILSVDDFGIFNTYMAYEGLLSAIIGLGLYGTIKNAKFDFPDDFDKYVSSINILTIVVSLMVLLLCNCFQAEIHLMTNLSGLVLNVLVFQSLGSSILHFYGIKLNTEFKYKEFLVISIFNTIGNILLSLFLIIYIFPTERYLGRIFGSALVPVALATFISLKLYFNGRTLYNKKFWVYASSIGFPLIIHVIAQSLLSQFDRVMIFNLVGASEAGIYSYVYTLCMITYVIAFSIDNAWTPWLFYKIKDNDIDIVFNTSSRYVELFSIITVFFMFLMPFCAPLIANEEYCLGIDLIIPISLANYFIFLYFLPVGIEYYHKRTSYISIGTILSALVNIVLNYYCIDYFGYKSAAFTTLVSYMFLFLFHLYISAKYDVFKIFDFRSIFRNTLFVCFIATCFLFIKNNVFKFVLTSLYFIYLIYKNKNILSDIRRIFK